MSNAKLMNELRAAGVPAVGASYTRRRVAQGDPHRTSSGQWIIDASSSPAVEVWIGHGPPTSTPNLASQAEAVLDAYEPDPPPTAEERALRDVRGALRALYRALPDSVRADWRREMGL